MDVPEQQLPNKPNFGLVMILSAVALIAILIGAYYFLHRDAGRMLPDGKAPHPAAALLQVE